MRLHLPQSLVPGGDFVSKAFNCLQTSCKEHFSWKSVCCMISHHTSSGNRWAYRFSSLASTSFCGRMPSRVFLDSLWTLHFPAETCPH